MGTKKSFKKEKLEEKIRQESNSYLRSKVADPRLKMISITKVKLNPDISVAMLYWDTFDISKKEEIENCIDGMKSTLRSHLSSILKIRHTPIINLLYDSQFESEKNIMDILNSEEIVGKNY